MVGRDDDVKVNYNNFSRTLAKVTDCMALDLQKAFLEASGFSARNLKNTRRFTDARPDDAIV